MTSTYAISTVYFSILIKLFYLFWSSTNSKFGEQACVVAVNNMSFLFCQKLYKLWRNLWNLHNKPMSNVLKLKIYDIRVVFIKPMEEVCILLVLIWTVSKNRLGSISIPFTRPTPQTHWFSTYGESLHP